MIHSNKSQKETTLGLACIAKQKKKKEKKH